MERKYGLSTSKLHHVTTVHKYCSLAQNTIFTKNLLSFGRIKMMFMSE